MKRRTNAQGYRLLVSTLLTALLLALLAACSDPASDKPKATVAEPNSNAKPSPPAMTGASGTKIALNPTSTTIEFIGSNPTMENRGTFKQASGEIELVGDKPEGSRVSVDIDMNSVETSDPKLTTHLKSPDFFDVAKFPKASFVSTEIKPGDKPGSYVVAGNLEMHGVKKAITFPATIAVSGDSVTMQAEFSINRKDFGIVYPGQVNNLIRDDVVLKLSVRASKAAK